MAAWTLLNWTGLHPWAQGAILNVIVIGVLLIIWDFIPDDFNPGIKK